MSRTSDQPAEDPRSPAVPPGRWPGVRGGTAGHLRAMSEMDPRDPSTLYAEGPVADEPPEDDLPDTSPLPDSGGTGPGPDDLDRLL